MWEVVNEYTRHSDSAGARPSLNSLPAPCQLVTALSSRLRCCCCRVRELGVGGWVAPGWGCHLSHYLQRSYITPVSREEWCKQWNMKHKLNWMLSFKVRRNIWAWMWASEFFVWLSAARLLSGAPCQHSSALASNWFTISVKVFIEPQLTALSEHRPRHSYQLSRGARSMALSFISSEDWAQDISQIVQLKLIQVNRNCRD